MPPFGSSWNSRPWQHRDSSAPKALGSHSEAGHLQACGSVRSHASAEACDEGHKQCRGHWAEAPSARPSSLCGIIPKCQPLLFLLMRQALLSSLPSPFFPEWIYHSMVPHCPSSFPLFSSQAKGRWRVLLYILAEIIPYAPSLFGVGPGDGE